MSLRKEQCNKVCRILDDVLANRPTERDSLIVAVQLAFEAQPEPLKIDLSGYSKEDWERLKKEWANTPITVLSAEPKKGKWIKYGRGGRIYKCNKCGNYLDLDGVNAGRGSANFCPNCGADMRGEQDG